MTMWGPRVEADGRTLFRLWAPDRTTVAVEIDGGETLAMTKEDGWFSVNAPAPAGTLQCPTRRRVCRPAVSMAGAW
jgi:maltooligosyltrehalose trehalohydrolase